MSDHESVDVTSTSFFTVSKCGYCDCEKEGLPVFHCESCAKWVHTSCLHSGSPSSILFDNFYIFKCVRCTENGKESFKRMKMTWNQVTNLALFNIAQCNAGKDGFHKWKDAIGGFIDKHWDLLFESYKKKTNTWINTIAATLSAGNPHQFTSGYGFFKESGWWRLTNPSIPPEYTPNTNDIKTKDARSKKSKLFTTCPPLPDVGKLEGLRKRPYSSSVVNASQLKEKRSRTQTLPKTLDTQEESHNDDIHEDSPPSFTGCASPISSMLSSPKSVTSITSKGDMTVDDTLPLVGLSDDDDLDQENVIEEGSYPFAHHFSPVSDNSSMVLNQNTSAHQNESACKGDAMANSTTPRSVFTPQRRKKLIKVSRTDVAQLSADSFTAAEMGLYEEQAMLRKLESYGPVLKDVPEAYRLRRKLLLRQEKRGMNLSVTSYEAKVRQSLVNENNMLIDKSIEQRNKWSMMMPISIHQCDRILDRFQRKTPIGNTEVQLNKTFHQKLVGKSHDDIPLSVVSPYTKRVLKPYIRRDYESRPTKLRVLEDIVTRYQQRYFTDVANSKLCSVPIDYCYIQPLHVPAINAACHHFFWPGIDISETLQYPDFSIVALYKKMVIGFAFMVPDVSFNEAYISFLFVHPDWQRAGIGTFMIYHLIQTCMGKEVTLHVSASNPAMLLYQKFGFKPEKFIADFYDKYHPAGSSECKHAFFLRLRR